MTALASAFELSLCQTFIEHFPAPPDLRVRLGRVQSGGVSSKTKYPLQRKEVLQVFDRKGKFVMFMSHSFMSHSEHDWKWPIDSLFSLLLPHPLLLCSRSPPSSFVLILPFLATVLLLTLAMARPKRAPAVVYDPDAHREFVTGFRRRKQARRQEAAASAASAEKEARRQMRKEKREVLRATAENFRDNSDDSDDDAKADEISREETTYQTDDAVVTAVVAPLETAIDKRVARNQNIATKPAVNGVSDGKDKPSRIGKVKKAPSNGGRKRRVSYTHTLSKLNKRKSQLKRRKEVTR